MLSRLSLQWKIAGGFSVVLLLMVSVSLWGYNRLGSVRATSDELASYNMPAVAMGADSLEILASMMLASRTLGLTGDEKAYQDYLKCLSELQAVFATAQSIKGKHAEELQKSVAQMNDKLKIYADLTRQTVDNMRQLAELKQRHETIAEALATQAQSLNNGKFTQLSADLNQSTLKMLLTANAALLDGCKQKLKALLDETQTVSSAEATVQSAKAAVLKTVADQQLLLDGVTANFKDRAELLQKRTANVYEIQAGVTELAHNQIKASTETVAENSKVLLSASKLILFSALISFVLGILGAIWLARRITRPILDSLPIYERVAGGDLTLTVAITSEDEIGQLGRQFNKLVTSLRELVHEVSGATREVASAATEIAASSEQMSSGMHEQNTQTQQVSAAIEQMSSTVIEVARKSAEAAGSANDAGQQADKGGEIVQSTIKEMTSIADEVHTTSDLIAELGKRGEQIGKIISVINDIADQTNLLALNAAIEAARAGEHGRGFAVVADEVRKLAERTTHATKEVADSITAIQHETNAAVQRMTTGTARVSEGVTLARQAGDALESIVAGAQNVAGMIQAIAAASEEQSAAAEEIARNVESISAVTRQSSDGASQAAAAATQLSAKSEQLQSLVAQFRI
jgi:methyl-accepting chemotaxis protein